MANLTADRDLLVEVEPGSGQENVEAANGVTFYRGSFIMLNTGTGYAAKAADTANFVWLGICARKVTGDTSATPVPKVEIIQGPMILRGYAVTGASAVTNQGTLVYASDDQTLTTSAAGNVKAVGRILKWYVSTTCDVMLFTPMESRNLN